MKGVTPGFLVKTQVNGFPKKDLRSGILNQPLVNRRRDDFIHPLNIQFLRLEKTPTLNPFPPNFRFTSIHHQPTTTSNFPEGLVPPINLPTGNKEEGKPFNPNKWEFPNSLE